MNQARFKAIHNSANAAAMASLGLKDPYNVRHSTTQKYFDILQLPFLLSCEPVTDNFCSIVDLPLGFVFFNLLRHALNY